MASAAAALKELATVLKTPYPAATKEREHALTAKFAVFTGRKRYGCYGLRAVLAFYDRIVSDHGYVLGYPDAVLCKRGT
jgi:hypothetical protein